MVVNGEVVMHERELQTVPMEHIRALARNVRPRLMKRFDAFIAGVPA